jgi:hypothetical protein
LTAARRSRSSRRTSRRWSRSRRASKGRSGPDSVLQSPRRLSPKVGWASGLASRRNPSPQAPS